MPRFSMHVPRRSKSVLSVGGALLVLTIRLGFHARRACGEQRLHRLPALGGCGFQGCTLVQFLLPVLPSIALSMVRFGAWCCDRCRDREGPPHAEQRDHSVPAV